MAKIYFHFFMSYFHLYFISASLKLNNYPYFLLCIIMLRCLNSWQEHELTLIKSIFYKLYGQYRAASSLTNDRSHVFIPTKDYRYGAIFVFWLTKYPITDTISDTKDSVRKWTVWMNQTELWTIEKLIRENYSQDSIWQSLLTQKNLSVFFFTQAHAPAKRVYRHKNNDPYRPQFSVQP